MSFAAEEVLFAVDHFLDYGEGALLGSADFAFAQVTFHEFVHFIEHLSSEGSLV